MSNADRLNSLGRAWHTATSSRRQKTINRSISSFFFGSRLLQVFLGQGQKSCTHHESETGARQVFHHVELVYACSIFRPLRPRSFLHMHFAASKLSMSLSGDGLPRMSLATHCLLGQLYPAKAYVCAFNHVRGTPGWAKFYKEVAKSSYSAGVLGLRRWW